MTPAEFIVENPTACQPGKDWIIHFPTMRDWWLSPDCRADWMLWALGRDEENKTGIVAFAEWCSGEAKRFAAAADAAADYAYAARWSASAADYAYAAYAAAGAASFVARWSAAARRSASAADAADAAAGAAAYAAGAAAYAAGAAGAAAYAAGAADAIQSQREKLREIFPDMFATKKETDHEI